jgi:hypothetical protein
LWGGRHACTVTIDGMPTSWNECLSRLRRLLDEHRGKLKMIAEESGLSYRWIRTFQAHEHGDVMPSLVQKLAKWFGLKITVTFQLDDKPTPPKKR